MKNIRLIILFMLSFVCGIMSAQTEKPDWVVNRPPALMDYIGIASSSKENPDYREIAKRSAMEELISQIEVTVSANSLMNISEKDDSELFSSFKETVKTTSEKRLENLQLYETWEDEDYYWVYYRLDKDEYAAQVKKAKDLATQKGCNLWQDGSRALDSGDLMTALDCFMNGLEVIEPFANENLTYKYEGKSYSLGNLLYSSFRTIFDGIVITASPEEIDIVSFNGKPTAINLKLTRENKPLRNMRIKGEFVNGSGNLSPVSATDAQGNVTIMLQNVTSKNVNQSIRFELDTKTFIKSSNVTYNKLLAYLNKNLPNCIVRLTNKENRTFSAYVESDDEENTMLVRNMRAFLNNRFFDIIETREDADVVIKLKTKIEKGAVVNGDMYNMNEYFTTINVRIIENRTGRELTNYNLESKRTLVPQKTSLSAARSSALRDAMKTVKRQLPEYLKNMKIDKKIVSSTPDFTETEKPAE